MSDVMWQDPPSTSGNNSEVVRRSNEFAAELRKNPGRWALYKPVTPTASHGATTANRLGLERTSRRNADGTTFSIYMRAPEATS